MTEGGAEPSLCPLLATGLNKYQFFRIYSRYDVCIAARNPSYNRRERPHVVNCSLSVMNQHCYWPLVSDLNNVLSHRPVAIKFMENDTLTNMWFSFLSYFQGTYYVNSIDRSESGSDNWI